MIVLPDRELVIFTPPHTASQHLHAALCRPPWSGFWVLGRWCDGQNDPDHHTVHVPPAWSDYRRVLVWRDPVDRCRGLYNHHCWYREQHGRQPLPWDQYAETINTGGTACVWELYHWRIADLVAGVQIDVLLDYADLSGGLARLMGAPVAMEPPYPGDRQPIDATLIADWAKPDYELRTRIGGTASVMTGH